MSDRVHSLDLLRGIAASAVAVPHFLLYRGMGGEPAEAMSVLAVEVFFVLSGFVLAPQILLITQNRSPAMLGRFLVRRWMRTVPAYLVALALASAIFGKLGSADFWRYAVYVQNAAAQENTSDYYSIAWSLSVEEWFYLTFPAFMLALAMISRRPVACAVAFVAVITAVRLGFAPSHDWGADVRRVVLFRVDAVAYGFLLWCAIQKRKVPFALAAALLAGGTIASAAALSFAETNAIARTAYPFAAACFGAGVILVSLSLERFAGRIASVCEASGILSYAIYLFHLIAAYIVAAVGLPFWPAVGAFLVLTMGLAWFSAYTFERPILAMRPALSATAKPVSVEGATA